MKNLPLFGLCFILILNTYSVHSQSKIGIGAFYGTGNALGMDVTVTNRGQSGIFKLGGSIEMDTDRRGEAVDEILSNYGRTKDGTGDYFYSVDLGYGRIIKDKFIIEGELSIGQKNYYTNYIDNRFKGGGYHFIDKEETIVGGGILTGYLISDNLGLNVGYNNIKGLSFGMRLYLQMTY
jgi:hypothetical protein